MKMKKRCIWRRRRKLLRRKFLEIKISKDIGYTKECVYQLENSLKDGNEDLAKVLKGNLLKI